MQIHRSKDLPTPCNVLSIDRSTKDVKLLATDVNPNLLFEVTTTAPELEGILSKINVNKAPGVDNLPVHVLVQKNRENAHFSEISQYYPNS